MYKRAATLCLAMLVLAVPAAAQDKPFSIIAGGALTAPLSDSADRFSTGLGFTAGVTWHFTSQLGLSGDYVWSALGAKDDWAAVAASRPVDVTPRIQFGTVGIKFQAPPGPVRPYLVAGGGLYHRTVRIATTGSADISLCDPWWLICSNGPVPVGTVNRTFSTTNPGINVGAGLTAGMFFVEIRYHYMWGPSIDTPSGSKQATGKFLPLTVGVVF